MKGRKRGSEDKLKTFWRRIYEYAEGQAINGGITSSEVALALDAPTRKVAAHISKMAANGRLVVVDRVIHPTGGSSNVLVRDDEVDIYGK